MKPREFFIHNKRATLIGLIALCLILLNITLYISSELSEFSSYRNTMYDKENGFCDFYCKFYQEIVSSSGSYLSAKYLIAASILYYRFRYLKIYRSCSCANQLFPGFPRLSAKNFTIFERIAIIGYTDLSHTSSLLRISFGKNIHVTRINCSSLLSPGSFSIVFYGECSNDFSSLSLSTVYEYYDDIVVNIRRLRNHTKIALVVWLMPFTSHDVSYELKALHHFLCFQYLGVENGIISLMPEEISSSMRISRNHILRNTQKISSEIISILKNQILFITIILQNNLRLNYSFVAPSGALTSISSLWQLSNISYDFSFDSNLHTLCKPLVNSRKFHKRCFPRPKLLYPLLITGLGGCGTHYVTSLCKEMGLDMAFESIGSHGAVVSM